MKKHAILFNGNAFCSINNKDKVRDLTTPFITNLTNGEITNALAQALSDGNIPRTLMGSN